MRRILASGVLASLSAISTFASGAPLLRCVSAAADGVREEHLVLTRPGENYVLERIDPTAEMQLAHLTIDASQVRIGTGTIVIDAFESRVGSLQMMVAFDVGASGSKHFFFDAEYTRPTNRDDYGLDHLSEVGAEGRTYTCVRVR